MNSTQGAMAMMLQKVKVYELAKELGMDSITLLDKLKRLEIDVKNHMSSLGSEEVKLVRDSIAKEQALLTKATKATKKREEEPTVQKRVGTTVIRRRAKSSGEDAGHPQSSGIEVTTSHPSEPEETYSEPQMTEAEPEKLSTMEAPEKVASHEPEAVVSAPVVPPTPVLRTPQETPAAAPAATTTTTPTAPARPRSTIIVTERAADRKAAEAAAAAKVAASRPAPLVRPRVPGAPMPTGSGLKIPSLLGARSAGLPIPRTSGILNIVKDDPRRSQPSRPGMGRGPHPGLPGQRPGQGIVNIGKEAIDRMVEEEQNFKKKGAAGKGEKDKDPLDVKVSDYRAKKELVFLPKKKKVPLHKEIRQTQITTPAAHKRVIKFVNTISVSELAQSMGIKSGEIIKKLIGMGVMANINHSLDFDTATLIANEYDYEVENVAFKEETLIPQVQDKPEDLQHRPPIVTVMGHVDHGKTSLLDAIRSENVAGGEAGGITQHIGAYTVDLNGKKITFIDTPGHEAFTVMRARGANVTDLVILVVAADDGVMPQTREAVDHARAANVPIIVAVNKIDKPGANPDKVMKGLAELNLLSEAWGGENIFVNVSAVKRTGIQELLESILLQAEMLDLKANPDRPGEGTVLEARLERSRGAVVNLLVKKGTVKIGDAIVAGSFCGKVRALTDDKGRQMKEIGPGYAAELLGLEGVPVAGDQFNVMGSDAEARDIAEHRHEKMRSADAAKSSKMSLEDLFSKVQQGNLKELPLVLKSDVFGSTEAIKESLAKLSTEKVKVKVISAGTGGISESDVMLASASNAIIIGFNVRPETKARALAEGESVEIKCYSIIYELLDDVKKAMAGLLDKKAVEKYLGRAEVRELFSVPKIGTVAGTSVVDGKITRGAQVRLLRDNRVIYTGKLSSLRRFKDDAKEVVQGYECGIGIENFNDLKQGDIIEAFMIEMVAQELDAPIASTESARA